MHSNLTEENIYLFLAELAIDTVIKHTLFHRVSIYFEQNLLEHEFANFTFLSIIVCDGIFHHCYGGLRHFFKIILFSISVNIWR